jgi:O-antigen/teichoic acid export membrane protein
MTQSDLVNRSRGQAAQVRGLAGQALWNNAALAIQLGGSFALIGLAFRRLTPAEVGAFSLVAVTAGLVQILDPAAGYVISRVVALDQAGRPDPANRELVAELRAGLVTVAGMLAGLCLITLGTPLVIGRPIAHSSLLLMTCLIVLGVCIQLATADWPATAVARGEYRRICASSTVTSVVTFFSAWLLIGSMGVAALGLALLAGQVLGRATFRLRRLDAQAKTVGRRLVLGRRSVASLWRHAGSIYTAAVAAQLLAVSDLWTVGLLNGPGASAAYRAGSLPPSQASALFYRLYDVLYPRLPRLSRPEQQEQAVQLATRVFCAAAGCLFTFLWILREPLVRLLIGQPDALSETVFTVFCAIWLVNVPIHGLALLLLSRGQQKILTPVAIVEAAVNILVSVVLVVWLGPIGAAIGTLATMAVSNVIVMPWLVERVVRGARRMVGLGFAWCLAAVALSLVLQAPGAIVLDGVPGALAAFAAGTIGLGTAVGLAAGRDGRRVLRAHV